MKLRFSRWTLAIAACLMLISCIGLQKKELFLKEDSISKVEPQTNSSLKVAESKSTPNSNSSKSRKLASDIHDDLYLGKVQPIFNNRCVACHACFNSPCQLNLTSFAGVDRGAIKDDPYAFNDVFDRNPTRLGVDVPQNYGVWETITNEWRNPRYGSSNEEGFFPVVNRSFEKPNENTQSSILYQLISLKRTYNSQVSDPNKRQLEFHSEQSRVCPSNENKLGKFESTELTQFKNSTPWNGMPYGFPELSVNEFNSIVEWIEAGSPPPDQQFMIQLSTPSPQVAQAISRWENFLNNYSKDSKDIKDYARRLTARYIYEHLFIGHIYFEENPGEFYRLIRASCDSMTHNCVELPTRRPTDSPKESPYYEKLQSGKIRYKFQKVTQTLVHKTHSPFKLTTEKMQKWEKMFINQIIANEKMIAKDDDGKYVFPEYGNEAAGNPFQTFKSIPAKSRYQFLLDDAYFFVMSFIKGPVCRGTGALSVIDDHFWVFFLDPNSDMTIKHPEFYDAVQEEITLPVNDGNKWTIFQLFEQRRRDARMQKKALYEKSFKEESKKFTLDDVWNGNGGEFEQNKKFNANAVLTVYRHEDSASVSRGPIGEMPKTMWMVDYPILEDIYYNLVAGYDVYSPLVHSMKTRLHMDASRFNSQDMYLAFLPQSRRNGNSKKDTNSIRASWTYDKNPNVEVPTCKVLPPELCAFYRQSAGTMREEVYPYAGPDVETGIKFNDMKKPQHELAKKIIAMLQEKGVIQNTNEFVNKALENPNPSMLDENERIFASTFAGRKGFFASHLPELSYVRVYEEGKADQWYSLIRNRERYNVAFVDDIVPDSEVIKPSADSLNVVRGFVGSYANAILNIPKSRVEEFSNDILRLPNNENSKVGNGFTISDFYKKYLVSRHNPHFWFYYDEMMKAAKINGVTKQSDPYEGSIIDLNRYVNDFGFKEDGNGIHQ